jgi:GH15 family glucan-1,4-alpha-glucosidase
MPDHNYVAAIQLLKEASSINGFLASALDISNYKRVWARDGVICGLAALASGDEKLIATFEKTIETLASYQHEMGTIPSNVSFSDKKIDVSYGGLAGRVDAVTWFVIGVCQLTFYKNDITYLHKYQAAIEKCFYLLNAWEFNNKHLLYVPLSGNWADEYITDGYVLYDQLLRLWALKSYNHFIKNDQLTQKIDDIQLQVTTNFFSNATGEKIHPRAFQSLKTASYCPASFSPSGYKTQFDALANSLLLILDLGDEKLKKDTFLYCDNLLNSTKLKVLPAFWPPIQEQDPEWNLLKDNCKYEFRNFPYEFHNGGSWSMVNGFYGIALYQNGHTAKATLLLKQIHQLNAVENHAFYENFNTQTGKPIGVAKCAWSAAASIMLHQTLNNQFKILID